MEATLLHTVEGMGARVMAHFSTVASQLENRIDSSNFDLQAQMDGIVMDQARSAEGQSELKRKTEDFEKQFQSMEDRFKLLETTPPARPLPVVPRLESAINEDGGTNPTIPFSFVPGDPMDNEFVVQFAGDLDLAARRAKKSLAALFLSEGEYMRITSTVPADDGGNDQEVSPWINPDKAMSSSEGMQLVASSKSLSSFLCHQDNESSLTKPRVSCRPLGETLPSSIGRRLTARTQPLNGSQPKLLPSALTQQSLQPSSTRPGCRWGKNKQRGFNTYRYPLTLLSASGNLSVLTWNAQALLRTESKRFNKKMAHLASVLRASSVSAPRGSWQCCCDDGCF
jgi:hypothetical protein